MSGLFLSFLISGGAVTLMLVLHAYLVMCEISLVKFRYGEADEEGLKRLRQHKGIVNLMDNGDQTGRVVRFSKTLCTVAVGLLLMPLVSDFFNLLQPKTQPDRWIVVFLSFTSAVSVHFFFAEIFPRGLAMRDPIKSLERTYRVLVVFQVMTLPVMLFFRALKRRLYKRLGVDIEDELNPLDLDVQIRAMGEDSGALTPVVRKIMNRTLQIQDLVVHDILLPRSQLVICNTEEDIKTNLETMKEAGHTRFPLCHGDLDNCIGIIHIKDIFRCSGPVDAIDLVKLKRTVAQFPLETPIEAALERMLRAQFHMALVVDDFGGVVGAVTMESILEELVGEIQDEFDSEEEQIVEIKASKAFHVSGLTPIHDIEERLDIEIDNAEVSTVGGLITGEIGRIPEKGEQLTIYGMKILVEEVDERRIIAVSILNDE